MVRRAARSGAACRRARRGAAASADQIALCSLQIRAIRSDPAFVGGDYYPSGARPRRRALHRPGLGQFSYRTAAEFQSRFGRAPQEAEEPLKGGRYAIESYLQHQGDKLIERFDPNSYIVLSEAMNHHDLGRDEAASPPPWPGARPGDRGRHHLRPPVPVGLQEELARLLPGPPRVIESEVGHDGFLVET